MNRILRKFCHDKYFSVAFHHWVEVTRDLAREETEKKRTESCNLSCNVVSRT